MRFIMRARVLALALATIVALTIFGSTGASAQGVPLFAVLNGGNECDGANPPLCRQGDLDAYGSATLIFPNTDPTRVCFGIVADNLAGATAAHIHRGVAGINGGIVVTLVPPNAPAGGNPGASSGCVVAGAALLAAIRANPSLFYINVHNAAFPDGAIRGQLF
jgi:hypothetical protein